jgi:murein DD-endopeptidase MepM/ murein hydrolase activator NlpD
MIEDGLRPSLVATFCDVFSCDVDFTTETKDGDAYEILVEDRRKHGQTIGSRILSGRYTGGGKSHEAFYYEGRGRGGYYRAGGESLRRAFLKSPLNYSRISSHFTHARRHPIFKTVRPHLGVDYAAPAGTPVVSVGDGVVQSAGWANGYGNLVRIRHKNGVVTYYAHLSRYGAGMRPGATVSQNQVLGYVGQTGHATGPHLDFRIQQNGRFVNPLTYKSAGGDPLPAAEKAAFAGVVTGYREMLASLDGGRSLSEAQFAAVMEKEAGSASH